ncbi:maleylpyruvate isomerase N-terminal domain-containing protein [Kitasatospora viridis]|uniref:Uncharacterized protein (TIGR03083 family) n=1 Tax=Kitasatospora viridis TaxID=281105 RepID=A0A561T7B7_9ACTN|nr:maleylpyruvate isomerase N-terminal domain-containing protein [Kitasatospora viridis]TWF82997.1 uncharacterized protein (TIGR03083 family) [Kitasatospora viridis]
MTETVASTVAASDDHGRPAEVTEFLNILDTARSDALTACPGRTVHMIGAHLAGNYLEITRHVDAYLKGEPLSRTRTFDEREPEFRRMTAPQLTASIADGEQRMRRSMAELLEREEDPVLRWTNREVHAAGFLKHSRSECAVHRWDIGGDDELGDALLSQPELLEHVVAFIGPLPMTARGMAAGAGTGKPFQARLRSPGQPDIVLRVHDGPKIALVEPEGEALIEGDPAARLLFLWGRRAVPFHRLTCNGSVEELSRLQWLLSGY